jgi:hypothetical protein
MKISQYKLKDGIGQITFKTTSGTRVLINNDNITDQLVALAEQHGRGHCFVKLSGEKKNAKPLTYPLQDVISTLTEVPTVKQDLLPVVENKRDAVLPEKKKRGRKPKSKE